MDTGITHADGQFAPRGTRPTPRTAHGPRRLRGRSVRLFLALSVAVVSCGLAGVGATVTAGPAGAAPAPSCVFSGTGLAGFGALVAAVKAGSVVNLNCKNFTASHSYLMVEASLLVAVDPAAKPLLEGQATSLPGLLAIIAASPELNPQSIAFPNSNAKGQLTYAYKVPSSQPLDPNATCPPTTQEYNSGLIGCTVAMIDLTTFKPVIAGTFVMNYATQGLFPPNPTSVVVSPTMVQRGQTVTVRDPAGAKTYWWLATLVSLYANLAGGSPSAGGIPVVVRLSGHKVKGSTVAVSPASYNGTTLTPPLISGHFIASRGRSVKFTLGATLLGIFLSQVLKTKLISK
jgi:hypothetical protein